MLVYCCNAGTVPTLTAKLAKNFDMSMNDRTVSMIIRFNQVNNSFLPIPVFIVGFLMETSAYDGPDYSSENR